MRREPGGTPSAGPSAEAWRDGGPAELTGLGLNLFGALLAQLAEEDETAEQFDGEHLLTLYGLSERAGAAQSVARLAALNDMWFIPPGHESDPAPSVPATGAYELPAPQALSAVLGLPSLTESDRTDLIPGAARLARLMDRLEVLGVTQHLRRCPHPHPTRHLLAARRPPPGHRRRSRRCLPHS